MILLFGEQAAKSSSTKKNSNVNNHPVENSGILAMSMSDAKSLLTMGEYDTYVSSSPVAIDYAMYADCGTDSDSGFMSEFSAAVAFLGGDGGFSSGSFDCGASSFSGSSCGSFASVC
ncbi:hypothetical protein HDR58_08425 [bacterium]|nr:hypothetical protein [bacterium]